MKRLLPLLVGLALLSKTDAFAGLFFWDTNGTDPGCGSATPTGTWGVDGYWNTNSTGGASTQIGEPWTGGATAIFAAGTDATGSYTIYVSGIIKVEGIHVDRGTVTFEPDPSVGGSLKMSTWDDVTAGRLLSAGAFDDNAVARYNVPLTDSTGVVRYKIGTVIFGATNTFTGSLTIESGLTLCAVPYCFSAAPSLVLANLDMTRTDVSLFWESWAAVFQTGGLDQQLGTLKFAGTNAAVERALDLGNGSGTLSFADSSAEDWTGYTLTIRNYALGSSKLRFGTSNTGLTATQLSQIQFAGIAGALAVIDSNGFVTPYLLKITAITPVGASFKLDWAALNGRTYRVWSKDTLTAASWDFQADVTASGETASHTDSTPSPSGRFYRVELL